MKAAVTAAGAAAISHLGPIRLDCPVQCLQLVLSQQAYLALTRAHGAQFPPPGTVGDAVRLAVFTLAGFDLSGHPPRPPGAPLPAGKPDALAGDPAAPAAPRTLQHSDQATPGPQPGAGPGAGCPVCGAPADFPPPQVGGSPMRRQPRPAERAKRVLAWLAVNCHRSDVTLAEVAGVAGVTPRHLQQILKRDFGRGPVRLMADMRLHRVHLTLTGRAPAPGSLAEAAAMAGYSRVSRFNDAYHARYGRCPALPGQPAAVRGARRARSRLPGPAGRPKEARL
jgi:AraC-like DNA-binding protein